MKEITVKLYNINELKNMLTKKQLKQLRNQVVLNSLYTSDYLNSLFIKEKTAFNFFKGYVEHLEEIATEEGYIFSDNNFFDFIKKYDTFNNLYNYYYMFEEDPLIQDNFIASKPLNNSDGIVIYKINDRFTYPYIYVAYLYLSGLYIKNTRIKKLRLYESVKRGYYFILDKSRYYLDEFARVNN